MNLHELRSMLSDAGEDSRFHTAALKIVELSQVDGCRVETDPAIPASELADIYRRRAYREKKMQAAVHGLSEAVSVLEECTGRIIPVALDAPEKGHGLVFLKEGVNTTFLACIFIDKRPSGTDFAGA